MASKEKEKYLILARLLDEKIIWIDEHNEYVGKASDDVEVSFGMVGNEKVIEQYLTDCPNPENW